MGRALKAVVVIASQLVAAALFVALTLSLFALLAAQDQPHSCGGA